ncbi:hypothetical protein CBL_03703 [Carabus blaptoides fortunei]
MSTNEANNKEHIPDYSMESFEGTIVNLEEIFQFKIGSELEEYTFNFDSDENNEELEGERNESKHELISKIVSELIDEVSSKLPENASKEHIVIDNMTLQEILEKLRCKCHEVKSILCTKYQKDTEADVKEQGDVSIDDASKYEAGDADMSESISGELHESIDLNEYLDIREYAIQYVDKLLDDAQAICAGAKYSVLNYKKPTWDPRESAKYYNIMRESCYEEEKVFQHPKLTIRDFTPDLGKDMVQNYVEMWCITKNWMYWIEYKAQRIDTCCDFYEYEVIWSLPTSEYPIPQITVTVFFIMKVSRVVPDLCPVNVKYYFETCGTEFSLTDELHHEAFLYDILCQKQRTLCTIRI